MGSGQRRRCWATPGAAPWPPTMFPPFSHKLTVRRELRAGRTHQPLSFAPNRAGTEITWRNIVSLLVQLSGSFYRTVSLGVNKDTFPALLATASLVRRFSFPPGRPCPPLLASSSTPSLFFLPRCSAAGWRVRSCCCYRYRLGRAPRWHRFHRPDLLFPAFFAFFSYWRIGWFVFVPGIPACPWCR